jgi:hypothetical protein
MRRSWPFGLLACVILAAVLSSCSGKTNQPETPPPNSTTPTQAAPSSSTAAAPTAATSIIQAAATTLLSAPVPASCMHAAGTLVNGVLPGIPAMNGEMQLAWLNGSAQQKAASIVVGDLNSDGKVDIATLLDCDAGGVSWPQIVAFYAPGPSLLGWAYLTDFNLPGIEAQENATAHLLTYDSGGVDVEWSTQEDGDAAADASLDYSANLRLSGHQIVAMRLVGTTEHDALNAFMADLRRGDVASASKLAAPGVGADAASQFKLDPAALAATPTCYGGTDTFTMPSSLAALIDSGGQSEVDPDTGRLCAVPTTIAGASWIALGMRHTGYRAWQVLWFKVI